MGPVGVVVIGSEAVAVGLPAFGAGLR